MIINTLVEILKGLSYPVHPFGSEKIEDCIIYNFVPLTNDGVKAQDRLEITVISQSMERGLKILEEVKEALITIGDRPRTDDILEINLNGGGSLENLETNTFHFKAFFVVLSRYRKGE